MKEGESFSGRWLALSILIGLCSGIGAIFFEESLQFILHNFLYRLTGYSEPKHGSSLETVTHLGQTHSWLFLIIPALGALISGILVAKMAPEAEGHGTDAMINSFHKLGGYVRKRIPVIKTIASAITIGSGGSAGKEGPIAQIGAGIGSVLATLLRLTPRRRRICMLAGASGGIGAIFHAPLGAAIFGAEVLYRSAELEYEAIIPCIIASVVGSSVFDLFYGRRAIFVPQGVDFDIIELPAYALFGVLCAVVGWLYVKIFYGTRDFFSKLWISKALRPAIGGALLGLIALFLPQVMDGGYGWIQAAMESKITWLTMISLVFAKILATSFTIGSGGSGGVFGPSVFIGAMLGGAFGSLGHILFPTWIIHPQAFVVVGIGGFFAAAGKVPISSIIMACEMCGNYTLLVPLMITSSVSYICLPRGVSIYEKQVSTRVASPAHWGEFSEAFLSSIRVADVLTNHNVPTVREDTPFRNLLEIIKSSHSRYVLVVNGGETLTGIVSVNDIREFLISLEDRQLLEPLVVVKDIAASPVVTVKPDDTVKSALEKMTSLGVDEIPVVDGEGSNRVVTMLSRRDILNAWLEKLA